MVYETIDFSVSIRNAMNDLDTTLMLVNTTLDDVKILKEKSNIMLAFLPTR